MFLRSGVNFLRSGPTGEIELCNSQNMPKKCPLLRHLLSQDHSWRCAGLLVQTLKHILLEPLCTS